MATRLRITKLTESSYGVQNFASDIDKQTADLRAMSTGELIEVVSNMFDEHTLYPQLEAIHDMEIGQTIMIPKEVI